MNPSQIEEDSGDMRWNSKTFHCASNIHVLQRRHRETLSSSDGRERQMECHLFFDYLFEIMKDPFLDICSFMEESQLDVLEKRALVTKDTFITARVYKKWLPKKQRKWDFHLRKGHSKD